MQKAEAQVPQDWKGRGPRGKTPLWVFAAAATVSSEQPLPRVAEAEGVMPV